MKGLFNRNKKASPGTSPTSPTTLSGLKKTSSFSGTASPVKKNASFDDRKNNGDEEAIFATSSASDNSRFFANNMDLDYSQSSESYGDLIFPKEMQEEKPSVGPLRNRNTILSNLSTDKPDEKYSEINLLPDEKQWYDMMTYRKQDESEKRNIKIGVDTLVDKEGWLVKEGRLVKSWKKRWFVLSGNTLGYYTAKKNKLKGSIILEGAKIELAMNRQDHVGCLQLLAREVAGEEDKSGDDDGAARTLFFDAETEQERKEWFVAITNKISLLNYQRKVQRKGKKPHASVMQFFELGNNAKVLDLTIQNPHQMTSNEQNLHGQLTDIVLAVKDPLRYHPSLTTISFKNLSLGDALFKQLCTSLVDNKSVTNMNLQGNNISADGFTDFANVLSKNSSLTCIHFDHNHIDDAAMISICNALERNAQSKLLTASFSYNKIGDEGIEALAKLVSTKKSQFPWKTLHVSHNLIGDEGATRIAQLLIENDKFPSLTAIELGYNKIKNDGAIAIANAMRKNKTIKLLDLEYNKIEYDGIKNLAFMIVENTTMDTMIIGGNKLGEQAFCLLANTDMNFPELEFSTKLVADQEDEN